MNYRFCKTKKSKIIINASKHVTQPRNLKKTQNNNNNNNTFKLTHVTKKTKRMKYFNNNIITNSHGTKNSMMQK
jgi:hypothetical protein